MLFVVLFGGDDDGEGCDLRAEALCALGAELCAGAPEAVSRMQMQMQRENIETSKTYSGVIKRHARFRRFGRGCYGWGGKCVWTWIQLLDGDGDGGGGGGADGRGRGSILSKV